MNKIMYRTILALVATVFLMASCEDDTMTPSFPKKVENAAVQTEAETITFDANMDWELSIPMNLTGYFWFDDPDRGRVNKIQGKAGKHTVKISITDEPDFDNDIYCPVTMKMGGKEKLVAEYTLLKSVREFHVYPATVDARGFYQFLEEGGIDFSDAEVQQLSMSYHLTTGFSLPVKFEAGVNYQMTLPEWLDVELLATSERPVGKRGACQAIFRLKEGQEIPTSSALTGDIVINVNKSDEVLKTITFEFKPVKNFVSWLSESEVIFKGNGDYASAMDESQTEYSGTLYGTEGVVLFAVAEFEKPGLQLGLWAGSDLDWVTLDCSEWDASGPAIQNYTVNVSMLPNPGAPRTADVYAVPVSLAGSNFDAATDAFNGDYSDVKEIFKPYKIMTLTQEYGGENIILVSGDATVLTAVEKSAYTPSDDAEMDVRYEILTEYTIQDIEKGLYCAVTSSDFTVKLPQSPGNIISYRYKPDESVSEVDDQLFTVVQTEGNVSISVNSEEPVQGVLIFQTADHIAIAALWIEYTPATTAN